MTRRPEPSHDLVEAIEWLIQEVSTRSNMDRRTEQHDAAREHLAMCIEKVLLEASRPSPGEI